MLHDKLKLPRYCQICGKEFDDTKKVSITLGICSDCQMSIYGTPSYLQASLNKSPINMLADATSYQNSLLQTLHPDAIQVTPNIFNIEPATLRIDPGTTIGIFDEVGKFQQNILNAAELGSLTINPVVHAVTEASLGISNTLSSVIQTDDYLERMMTPSYNGWLNPTNITEGSVLSNDVTSRITGILGTSIAADNAFLAYDPIKLYDVAGIHVNIAELSINSLNDMTGEYKSLWTDSLNNIDSIVGASSLVVERPPFEIYQAGTLAEVIAPLEEPYVEEVPVKAPGTVLAPTDIRDKILSLGKPFLTMYDGAVEAINIPLTDSQRHACVSLRELVTHTLHKLAPDEDVLGYANGLADAHEYLHEGRPTRNGRVRYISRKIDTRGFSKFLDADAKSTLAFIDLLQEGTHSLETPYSEKQVKALLSRAEGLLSFLIDISNT